MSADPPSAPRLPMPEHPLVMIDHRHPGLLSHWRQDSTGRVSALVAVLTGDIQEPFDAIWVRTDRLTPVDIAQQQETLPTEK